MAINAEKIIFYIFILVSIFSCKHTSVDEEEAPWFSNDPLTIPQRIRLQKYTKGNLVHNPSFELGRIYNLPDTSAFNFKLDGWRKIGDHVEWVYIRMDSIYDVDEVNSGNHAIKICREKANETETIGEGIQSDYIKVIPGKFNLTVYLRAKNIKSYSSRLGTKLNDAIAIEIKYYDKNKIEIPGIYYIKHLHKEIDIGFKGYPFANHSSIENLDWCKINARSHNNLLTAGSIPDNARYVKIFIGLKGTGTIWIDNVEYVYSKINFSPLERFSYLTDTTNTIQNYLIPQPKYVELKSAIKYYTEKGISSVYIQIPENAGAFILYCAKFLKKKIQEISQPFSDTEVQINIGYHLNEKDLLSYNLIFSIGSTNLYKDFNDYLPFKEISSRGKYAYFIDHASDLPNVVFLHGNSDNACFYSILTAIQLFDKLQGIYHSASIMDYPDFEKRNILVSDDILANNKEIESNIKALISYKLNGIYLESGSQHKYENNSPLLNKLKRISSFSGNSSILRWSYLQSPLDSMEDQINDRKKLHKKLEWDTRQINYMISRGANTIAYFSNISFPENIKQKNIINSIEIFDQEIDFLKHIKRTYLNIKLEYRPFWSSTCLLTKQEERAFLLGKYLSESFVNRYIYTGHDKNSFYLDELDIQYYHSFSNAPVVFWDNSLSSLSYESLSKQLLSSDEIEQYKMFSLFEPYGNSFNISEKSYIYIDKIILNTYPVSELEKIRITTALDFFWNIKKYDPDQSLWKVLVSNYGRKNAIELIYYNDLFFSLYKNLVKLEKGILLKVNKQTSDQLQLSEIALQNLAMSMGEDHPLIIELLSLHTSIKGRIKKFEIIETPTE